MVKCLVLVLLATLLVPDPADACSCALLSPCHTFWMADTVFIGHAQSVVEKTRGNQVTRFVVEEWLRGERVGAEMTTTSYGVGGSCDYGFQQGVKYLVHASKRADGSWSVFLCGGTAPIEQAADALRYIRAALAHPGEGRLSGFAFVDIDPGTGVKSGPSISNVRLVLRGANRELMTRTGPDGTYRFEAVPPGDFILTVELPPDYTPVPPKHLAIGKDACVNHNFWTTKR